MKMMNHLNCLWKGISIAVFPILLYAACADGEFSKEAGGPAAGAAAKSSGAMPAARAAVPASKLSAVRPAAPGALAPVAKEGGNAGDSLNIGANAGVKNGAALNLEQIAEIERAGAYFPGLGLAESALREKAGDYAGAALAAYKELSWAYGCGFATGAQVEERLQSTLLLLQKSLPFLDDSASDALKGCMAFAREDWAAAKEYLSRALPDTTRAEEEPDSFLRWMLLVCALELEQVETATRSAYSAIRARYSHFPEYWYRGARAFSSNVNLAASYAEQCINLCSQGPFAADCRKILAGHLGLAPDGKESSADIHSSIKTKAEIENIIRASVSMKNPLVLEELYPLMKLPENPYTLYALGAMKALTAVPEYRSFFIDGALKSPGRLGERLNYIARG